MTSCSLRTCISGEYRSNLPHALAPFCCLAIAYLSLSLFSSPSPRHSTPHLHPTPTDEDGSIEKGTPMAEGEADNTAEEEGPREEIAMPSAFLPEAPIDFQNPFPLEPWKYLC